MRLSQSFSFSQNDGAKLQLLFRSNKFFFHQLLFASYRYDHLEEFVHDSKEDPITSGRVDR